MKRQSGFTLVEIAIVLVVIGLLLGGVLKGQELVMNAKIRNSINDYNNVASARFAYQDRYRRIPGDDNTAEARWGATTTVQGNGNGVLEGGWDTSGDEATIFWHHLRNDNLIAGSRDATDNATFDNPQNAFNGITGVQEDAFGGEMRGDVICQSAVPSKAAVLIDTRIDDGTGAGAGGDSGGLMATDMENGITGTPETDYGNASKYIMCREL
jgi:prepilin-type N-terminal cleavage/methylation domain-containing protein